MTINEIIENSNIKADRYGMAAISCIYKAFGDNVRSKQYWPWGRDVQCEWYPSKGTIQDILEAELLLERSLLKIEEEQEESDVNNYKNIDTISTMNIEKNMTELKRKINKLTNTINKINNISDGVSNTSDETNNKI